MSEDDMIGKDQIEMDSVYIVDGGCPSRQSKMDKRLNVNSLVDQVYILCQKTS